METAEVTLTPLERKWMEQKQNTAPTIDDVFGDDGKLSEEKLDRLVRGRLPHPTGWRLSILPYRGARVSKGGIALSDETQKRAQLSTTCGYVLEAGPLAYCDQEKFLIGPWCKPGDWIIFGRYAGSRIPIDGGEIRFINDDEVLGIVSDPEDILHMV